MQELYDVERSMKDEGVVGAARLEVRETLVRPILEGLRQKIDSIGQAVTPQSALGKAVSYAQGQWLRLLEYLTVAEAPPDNNSVESALRPVVLGRKNWMHLGSPDGGGERVEVFFTLVQSCLRLCVNPFEYLSDVLERISAHPADRMHELAPRHWRDARARSAALSPAR